MNYLHLSDQEEILREEPALGERGVVSDWSIDLLSESDDTVPDEIPLIIDQLAREACWWAFIGKGLCSGDQPFRVAARVTLERCFKIGMGGPVTPSNRRIQHVPADGQEWINARAEEIMHETAAAHQEKQFAATRAMLRESCMKSYLDGRRVTQGGDSDRTIH